MSEKKEYRRIKTLTTKSGKKRYNLRKRKYSDCCELCGRTHTNKGVVARIVYHHWDDGNLNKGIWVCTGCHFLVEKLDNEFSLVSKYFSMKRTLIRSFPIQRMLLLYLKKLAKANRSIYNLVLIWE